MDSQQKRGRDRKQRQNREAKEERRRERARQKLQAGERPDAIVTLAEAYGELPVEGRPEASASGEQARREDESAPGPQA